MNTTKTSTDKNATITSAPSLGNVSVPTGFAAVNNVTFATSCAFSDIGCYETCSTLADACSNSWALYNLLAQTLLRTASNLPSYAYNTLTLSDTWAYTSYLESVVSTTYTVSAPPFTWARVLEVPVSGCTATDSQSEVLYTSATVTSPYTVVVQTPKCSMVTTTVSLLSPRQTSRSIVRGSIDLSQC